MQARLVSSLRLLAAAAALALLWAPASALAGTTLDHPELVDIQQSFVPPDPAGNANASSANITVTNYTTYSQLGARADGRISGSSPGDTTTNSLTLRWTLYEPDLLKRGPRSALLSQRSYLFLSLSGSIDDSSTSTSGLFEGCGARAAVRDDNFGVRRVAAWRVSCSPRTLMTQLGLTAKEVRQLFRVLGLRAPVFGNRVTTLGAD